MGLLQPIGKAEGVYDRGDQSATLSSPLHAAAPVEAACVLSPLNLALASHQSNFIFQLN